MDSSIYKKIMDYLLDLIGRNASVPNYKLPSERMLAAHFEASRKPVQHAYDKLIEYGYVTKVHGSGYFIRSDIKAERLQSAIYKNVRIAFITVSAKTRFSHAILTGIGDFCAEHKIEYTVHFSDNSPTKEAALLHSLPRSGAMGVILFPVDDEYPYQEELIRYSLRKYPFVLVDRALPNISASFIASDNHNAMVDAVRFLYERNYKNPLFITPPTHIAATVEARINGYTHGLLKYYKIAAPRNLLSLGGGAAQQQESIARLLRKYPDTDAIIVQGTLCDPVLTTLRSLHMEHIRLMVFDDELSYAVRRQLQPYFIQQDGYHIGYYAAQTLYNHILGDTHPVAKRLPVSIVDFEGKVD